MSARRDVSLDDVVARLESLPPEAWNPPEAPPLTVDFGLIAPAAPTAATSPRAAWLTRLGARLSAPLMVRPATAFVAATAVLLAGFGGGLLLQGSGDTPDRFDGVTVQLASLPGFSGARAIASMNATKTAMELDVSGLPKLKPGEYYELWALNSPQDLVPVGSFRVAEDGAATVDFAVGLDANRYAGFDISIERDDGNPGHSGRSVVRSALPA